MSDDFYKVAFDSAVTELVELISRHSTLKKELVEAEERIDRVRQGVLGLAFLANVDLNQTKEKYPDLFEGESSGSSQLGITDAIRKAMKSGGNMMTPLEIRDSVYGINPTIATHKNPLASIHAVLKRLVDSNEVVTGVSKDGKTAYCWAGDSESRQRIAEASKNDADIVKKETQENTPATSSVESARLNKQSKSKQIDKEEAKPTKTWKELLEDERKKKV